MPDAMPFPIGVPARCADGVCGHVTQVVLDPIDDKVTHIVVEPEHRQGIGRLVPIDAATGHGGEVDLRYTKAQFDELPRAEEIRFLPGTVGYPGYEPKQLLMWPHFGTDTTEPIVADTLPAGEVPVQRGETVHAIDGQIGIVDGVIVDRRSRHVTHIVLKEGHFFGRKDVAIPIDAVREVNTDGIRLSMSRRDVQGLPSIDFHRPDR